MMTMHLGLGAEDETLVRATLDNHAARRSAGLAASVIAIQRTAGNRSVARWAARRDARRPSLTAPLLARQPRPHGGASEGRAGLNVAFYTVGDDRVKAEWDEAGEHHILHVSDVYRQVAERAAPAHAHGVRSVADAIQILQTLPDRSVRRLSLIGHGVEGAGAGDFVFAATMQGPNDVRATSLLRDPTAGGVEGELGRRFFLELARVAQDDLRVDASYCWSARGSFLGQMAGALRQSGRGIHFLLRGTRNFFDIGVQQVRRHQQLGPPRLRIIGTLERSIPQ